MTAYHDEDENMLAADALAANDAALSEMRAERDDAIATVHLLQDQHKRQNDHDTALLERARKALEPFAEEVERVEKSYAEFNSGNRSPLLLDDDSHYLGNRIKWRHLRAAARALAPQEIK